MRRISLIAAVTLLSTLAPAQLNPCVFAPIRPTCGPILVGTDKIVKSGGVEYHLIAFHAAKAPASAMGVLAFGTRQIKQQFPGTRCFLLTNVSPSWAIPFHTNAHGVASIAFRVKGKLHGIVFGQSGFVKLRHLTTSNALKIGCR